MIMEELLPLSKMSLFGIFVFYQVPPTFIMGQEWSYSDDNICQVRAGDTKVPGGRAAPLCDARWCHHEL